ncbi:MAG: FISUMP domain-containing protein, partial [Bacteroidota bacterium]
LVSISGDVPGTVYNWVNSNTSIGLGAGGSGNISSFTATNTSFVPVTATITVTPVFTNAGTTCTGISNSFTITVNPLPIPNISGAPSVCSGTTGLRYNTETGMTGYQWTISSGGSITSGQGSDTITVTWSTIGPQSLTVNYFDLNGCTAPTSTSYPVNVQNLPTPSLTGKQYVCVMDTATYFTDEGATSYLWSIPTAGGTYTGGGSSDYRLKMTWLNPGTYIININYTVGSTGCTAPVPITLSVTVNPNPNPVIIGPTDPICGFSTQRYTTGSSGHVYQWAPTGGTIQSGGGSNSIFVLWGNTLPVYVDLTETINYPGPVSCRTDAPTYLVSFKPWPTTPDPIVGLNGVCKSSSHYYSVPTIPYATNHHWVYSGSGATITGNGNDTINISFSAVATNGMLTVTGKNDCGDGPVSAPLAISVNPLPVVSYNFCNDPVTTLNAKRFILKGGTPLLKGIPAQEGFSTITGVMGNNPIELSGGAYYFNPGLLSTYETGVYPITYTYTNQFGCTSSSSSHFITVVPSNGNFQCGNILTDPRETPQKTYHTLWIGSQCWMQENLRYGSTVSFNDPQSDNCTFERYCLSSNQDCSKGGLYQWDELMQYNGYDKAQGFCPPGWHVPNELEWTNMINSVSGGLGNGVAGSFMKDTNTYNSFKGKPAGIFYLNSLQAFTGSSLQATFFWTSTNNAATLQAVARGLNSITPSVSRYEGARANAFPARCVKD